MHARRPRAGRMNRADPSKAGGDTPIRVAKIGLVGALLAAVIGATATVVSTLIHNEPSRTPSTPPADTAAGRPVEMPLPDCPTCFEGGQTFTQQANTGNSKPTFRDPRAFKGMGVPVQPGQQVEVVCRFRDPNAPPSVQPGWWYLIATPPWNRQYYTVANSYLNGDPPEGPHLTDVDNGVPIC